jgi:murein DD-endopeptidase MepM/ murein hydrolase activator NlpD
MKKRYVNLLGAALCLLPWAGLKAADLSACGAAPVGRGVYRVSSPYGPRVHPLDGILRMHRGIDLACTLGTPVYAVRGGLVAFAGRSGCYGNVVVLRHPGDVLTLYAHLSRISPLLNSGASVVQGELIGLAGATGCVTGPHLHFELWKAGRRVNPALVCAPLRLRSMRLASYNREVR